MIVTLAHEATGRLRFVVPLPAVASGRAAAMLQQLRDQPGVIDVQVRSRSGSLIVYHDGEPTSRQRILRLLGATAPPRNSERVLDPLIDALADSLLRHVARAMIRAVL